MKNIFLVVTIVTLSLSFSTSCQSDNVDKFYNYLGYEQAKVLEQTVRYFNQFLMDNFNNETSKQDRIYAFLRYLNDNNLEPNNNWKYDIKVCKELIDEFEKTGLRKEIWMYGNETYRIDSSINKYYENYQKKVIGHDNEIDNEQQFDEDFLSNLPESDDSIFRAQMIKDSLDFLNDTTYTYSKIIVGVDKFKTNEAIISNFTNAMLLSEEMSSGIFVKGLLEADKKSYQNPFVDIIIIKELFYGMMESNCKQRHFLY